MKKVTILASVAIVALFVYAAIIFVSGHNAKTFAEEKLINMKNKDFTVENVGKVDLEYTLTGYRLNIDSLEVIGKNEFADGIKFKINDKVLIVNSIFQPSKFKFILPSQILVDFTSDQTYKSVVNIGPGSQITSNISLKSPDNYKSKLSFSKMEIVLDSGNKLFESGPYVMIVSAEKKEGVDNFYLYNSVKDISTSALVLSDSDKEMYKKIEELDKKLNNAEYVLELKAKRDSESRQFFSASIDKFNYISGDKSFSLNGSIENAGENNNANANLKVTNVQQWLEYYYNLFNVIAKHYKERNLPEYEKIAIFENITDTDKAYVNDVLKFIDPNLADSGDLSVLFNMQGQDISINNKSLIEIIMGLGAVTEKYYPVEGDKKNNVKQQPKQ